MTLDDFLHFNRIKKSKFASQIGVTHQSVIAYCNGTAIPNRIRMEAICAQTNGQVTPNDFYAIDCGNNTPDQAA